MASARHDLGQAIKLNASAIGAPGQRHFRLDIEGEAGRASLWLEKGQLFNLALAAKRLLVLASRNEPPSQTAIPDPLSGSADLDFQASGFMLSQEEESGLFFLGAQETEETSDPMPTVGVRATTEQLEALADQALEVCAAGRALCSLCGAPLDPVPHLCTRSNGHLTRRSE